MHFCRLATLGFMLVAFPVAAQAGGGHSFANRICSQKVPCLESSANATSAQWAAAGDACITQTIGLTNPDGFIDEISGLDADGCLTAKPDSLIVGPSKTHLTPKCCIVKAAANTCNIHCDITD